MCALGRLDFVDRLLTEDGSKLRTEYALDGTHIHPIYIAVLSEALNAVM